MGSILLHKLDTIKAITCLFFLATIFCISNSARILDEINPQQPQVINDLPQLGPTATILPSSQTPLATAPANAASAAFVDDTDEAPVPVASPSTEQNPEDPQPEAEVPAVPEETPAVGAPVAASPATGADADEDADAASIPRVATPSAAAEPVAKEPSLSFFMHDILGGSHPSARVVAGIVASTDVTGLPFSKINNNLFPITGGIPLTNPKLKGIVTSNNLPLLVGLNGGQSSTMFQNRGTNNAVTGSGNKPFVSAGNLPTGFTIQKLMFGSITVIDNQITEERDLDSTVIRRAQGFYLASSMDGTSQTVALTVLLHGGVGDHGVAEDSISLFGLHRTASPESEIAVVGGTGKYENARGHARVETFPKKDHYTTDGADTVLHFSVYLTE